MCASELRKLTRIHTVVILIPRPLRDREAVNQLDATVQFHLRFITTSRPVGH